MSTDCMASQNIFGWQRLFTARKQSKVENTLMTLTVSAVDSYMLYLACTSKATQKPEMKLKSITNRIDYIIYRCVI